jgi:hypothetical protein
VFSLTFIFSVFNLSSCSAVQLPTVWKGGKKWVFANFEFSGSDWEEKS